MQVLGLLCRCLALRVLSLPVLPAAAPAEHLNGSMQHALVQLLLQQALSEAMPAAGAVMNQSHWRGAQQAGEGSMDHSQSPASAYAAAAQAVLEHDAVQQLLKLLARLQLQTRARIDLVRSGC